MLSSVLILNYHINIFCSSYSAIRSSLKALLLGYRLLIHFAMSVVFTLYSVIFLISTMLSLFVAFLAWQRKHINGAKELTWLMIASAIWTFANIFESAAILPETKIFWSKIEYFGATGAPLCYLLFTLRFTGNHRFITRKTISLLAIIPLVTIALAFTNEMHHLIWVGFSEVSPQTNLMQYYHGIGFWLGLIAYNYLLFGFAIAMIVLFVWKQRGKGPTRIWMIILAGFFPFIASIFYAFGWSPLPGLNLSPISVSFSGLLFFIAIVYVRLLNLVPYAREVLVETLQDGIVVLDKHKIVQDINNSAMKYLGVRDEIILGEEWKQIVVADEEMKSILLEEKPVTIYQRGINDKNTWFKITSQPIKEQPGSHLFLIQDITDETQKQLSIENSEKRLQNLNASLEEYNQQIKRKNQLLEESQQELKNRLETINQQSEIIQFKQNFLANMSHEIRTPLTGIMGMIDMLGGSKPTELQFQYINILKQSGENLREIINQVLDYSKIEAGKMQLKYSTFPFNDIIIAANNLFKSIAHNDIVFSAKTDNRIPVSLRADKNRIIQVVNNLISNAVKFTSKGSISVNSELITVDTENNSTLIKISVTDTGIGIRSEKQKILFQPFAQTHETDSRLYDGTGLGLSICRELVQLHEGEIGVISTPMQGSTFWFTFKAQLPNPDEATDTPDESNINIPKNLRILLVEDKAINQKVIELLFSSYGYEISIAKNGKECLDVYKPGMFDIILMDIQMPVMDGITATKKLKEMHIDLPPIIGLSANAFEGDREKYMNLGLDEYITKPINKDDFFTVVSKFLSK